jgi:hypothetical protein
MREPPGLAGVELAVSTVAAIADCRHHELRSKGTAYAEPATAPVRVISCSTRVRMSDVPAIVAPRQGQRRNELVEVEGVDASRGVPLFHRSQT